MKQRIMIVDDDRSFLRSMEILLTEKSFEVKTFTSSLDADCYIREGNRVDVLILDYLMPEINGIEFLDKIEKYLGGDEKILLVSGHRDKIDRENLEELGIDEFFPKPVTYREFLECIDEKCEQKN